MELFKNRPFALFCGIFMLCAVGGFFVPGLVKLILGGILLALLITCAVICIVKKRIFFWFKPTVLISVAVLIAALSSFSYFDIGYMGMRKHDGAICDIDAYVTDAEYYSDYASAYTVRLISVNGEPCGSLAYLECHYNCGLQPGNRFSISAQMSEPSDTSFGYSQKTSMISDGIFSVIISESEADYTVAEKYHESAEVFFGKLNDELSARLSRIVGGESGDLSSAVLLADKSGLSAQTRRDFARAGVSHILALSGLHMAIIVAIADFFLKKLFVPKTARCIVLTVLLVLYLYLVGFTLSAVRSVIMIAMLYLAYLLRTSTDTVTNLFCAGFLILLISPGAVCDAGFWMSFLATLGIVLVSPYVAKIFQFKRRDGDVKIFFLRIARYFLTAVVVTVVANLSVVFLSWLCFGSVYLIAPVSNLLIAPLSGVLIFLSAICLLLYWIAPALSVLCAFGAERIGTLMLNICARFSDVRNIGVSLKYDFAGVIICVFFVATAVLLVVKLKHKIITLAPTAAAILAFIVCLSVFNFANEGNISSVYLKKNGGELFVFSENGKTVICDVSEGYSSRFSLAASVAKEYYSTEIEILMLTHYHSRQPQAVDHLFASYKTRNLWLPEPQSKTEYSVFLDLLRKAQEEGVCVTVYRQGEQMTLFGSASLTVFPYDKLSRSVEALVGFSIESGGRRLTYLGSSYFESDFEAEAREYILSSDAVILGSHGPNIKKPFSFKLGKDCEKLIIADESVAKNAQIECPNGVSPIALYDPDFCEFVLN